MAPPFVRFWPGPNPPIDPPLLGAHKTLGGFLLGVAAAVATAGVQALLTPGWLTQTHHHWASWGFALGLGAMVGDCTKSALKRARRLPPGARWVPFDQLDFAMGALVMLWPTLRPGALDVIGALAAIFVADLIVNRLAYRLRLKSTPW